MYSRYSSQAGREHVSTTSRDTARAAIETARDEMQDYYADRTEEWQSSDKAEAVQEKIDALDSILSDLDALE